MKVSHTIKGIKSLPKRLDKFKAEVLSGQVRAVQEGTLLIHKYAVEGIQENSGGKPQLRYGPKRTVVAAPPGKPPNTDTGRLVQSIKLDFKKSGLVGRVGTNLRYGAYLEFGTENMEPRPWLSTAVRQAGKEIASIFEKAMKGEIRKAGK